MKISIFNGSPRGERSVTHLIVREFMKGAAEARAECEYVLLGDKDVRPCLGCFDCWLASPGECVQNDDVAPLLKSFMTSDVAVIASPVYLESVTGIMKNFLDRMLPLADPHIDKTADGEYVHSRRFQRYPDMVLISNSGFPGQEQFDVFREQMRGLARHLHTKIIGEIFRDAGPILKKHAPFIKPFIISYRQRLQDAGREIVFDRRISQETKKRLKEEIIPPSQYVNAINKMLDQALALCDEEDLD